MDKKGSIVSSIHQENVLLGGGRCWKLSATCHRDRSATSVRSAPGSARILQVTASLFPFAVQSIAFTFMRGCTLDLYTATLTVQRAKTETFVNRRGITIPNDYERIRIFKRPGIPHIVLVVSLGF